MFYTFDQNNSGGYFIVNDYVAHYLIIEEVDDIAANDKMEDITRGYNEYCSCCGERWSESWCSGTNEPSIYGKPAREFLEDNKWFRDRTVIIYYLDGTKETITLDKC